jgi:glycosyltransferase involved in cell wall biosynthesis
LRNPAPRKLSVVIACHNAEDTIEVQLESLARQRCDIPWEVIVADNGSTDRSMEKVRRYEGSIPGLKIVDASARKGQAYARNAGARAASGDALLFCDADDEVAPGWVAALGKALETHQFVASRMDAERLSSPRSLRAKGNRRQQEGLIQYTYVPYLPFAGGGGLGITRAIHEAVSGFDETMRYLEDCDYCWRVQLTGVDLVFVPDALVHIRHRDVGAGLYRQARNWGEYNVVLLKRYQPHGMPKPGWREGWRLWRKLIRSIPELGDQSTRDSWIWSLGYRMGHLRGSVRYRFLAP